MTEANRQGTWAGRGVMLQTPNGVYSVTVCKISQRKKFYSLTIIEKHTVYFWNNHSTMQKFSQIGKSPLR